MNRREFLFSITALATISLLPHSKTFALNGGASLPEVRDFFLQIVEGYWRASAKTSSSLAVCDFPDGTLLKGCTNPAGHTYVSVARMLPALAWWRKSGREPQTFTVAGELQSLDDLLVRICRSAFDPEHPEYWGAARSDKADQRQVEASLVAYALVALGDSLLEKLGSEIRTNIQQWLASCTVVPEHKHNHAWFSAINQAARLKLSSKWKEFSGDEKWMLDDLAALETMAVGDTGWYNDWPDGQVFDCYNFWTFASHYLYWDEIIGDEYPQVRDRFRKRLAAFLADAPYFFSGTGSHVLFGRSLIYRWAIIMPLVLAYRRGLWPQSPGLLRSIVRRNVEYCKKLGAFDEEKGKLRETYSRDGCPDIRERYIDNGHPYWAMQEFAFFDIPDEDPFWSATEEPFPVEQKSFVQRFDQLGMIVLGDSRTGEVSVMQSRNLHKDPYRDKYIKFSYSSHFPFCVIADSNKIPWDQTLVFTAPDGTNAARSKVQGGGLLQDGTWTEWSAELGKCKIDVRSEVRILSQGEHRKHIVKLSGNIPPEGIEAKEGSHALGLGIGESCRTIEVGGAIRVEKGDGTAIEVRRFSGRDASVARNFYDLEKTPNVIYPRISVITLFSRLKKAETILESEFYAFPAIS